MDQIEEALLLEQMRLLTDRVRLLAERTLFYERVLRQACLAHGGRLVIDPSTSEEACKPGRSLVFGLFPDGSGQSGVLLIEDREVREWTKGQYTWTS